MAKEKIIKQTNMDLITAEHLCHKCKRKITFRGTMKEFLEMAEEHHLKCGRRWRK